MMKRVFMGFWLGFMRKKGGIGFLEGVKKLCKFLLWKKEDGIGKKFMAVCQLGEKIVT